MKGDSFRGFSFLTVYELRCSATPFLIYLFYSIHRKIDNFTEKGDDVKYILQTNLFFCTVYSHTKGYPLKKKKEKRERKNTRFFPPFLFSSTHQGGKKKGGETKAILVATWRHGKGSCGA
eukprot:TRINITY_DN13906_c0_g1_i1.p1 TRINITY_DN13906_c0_g1~~TRINITY_DN13906_c0_g1_i1.p1  ORF type:complete len:120 (-),score=2.91 TRINITY_DN13906_c0_g1_i1:142-501(-)